MADKLTRPFQSFKSGVTAIPTQFFSDVLPWIDDMDELKVTFTNKLWCDFVNSKVHAGKL